MNSRHLGLLGMMVLGAACAPTTQDKVEVHARTNGLDPAGITSRGGGGGGLTTRSGATPSFRPGAHGGGPFRVSRHDIRSRIASYTPDYNLVLPHWVGSFDSGGTTYNYAVVGSDPALGQTTTIQALVIPYRFVFADGTVLDASTDLIDGITPLQGVMTSPIFQPAPFSAGKTSLGTTQWSDAILRANFWDRRPKSDGYHVLLAPTVLPTVTINVPANHGTTAIDPGSGRPVAAIDFEYANELMQYETAALGATPDKVAIHLFSEIELTQFNGGGALGYHFAVDMSSVTGIPGNQTYIAAAYYGRTAFEGRTAAYGTAVLGHEISEWLNDPNVQNSAPAWQPPSSPHQCYSSGLEVADPIEYQNVSLQIPLDGRVYNLPDIAFTSYFSRATSSHSVNGWRTLLNTFSTSSIPCSYDPFYVSFFQFADSTGVGEPTALTGVNNKSGAVGYLQSGGFNYGLIFNAYDPIHTGVGPAAIIAVPNTAQPGFIWESIPTGISDAGTVVGYYFDDVGTHGFTYANGQYTTIDFPGATATYVYGLNNRTNPDYVGQWFDGNNVSHGFVLRHGKFKTVDSPFGTNTSINAINDHRIIVGEYDSGGPTGGFEASLRDDDGDGDDRGSVWLAINYPYSETGVSVSTQLTGVSNAGEVIGFTTLSAPGETSVTVGLDDIDGNFQTLTGGVDWNEAYSTVPNAINASGVIVGMTTDHYGTQGYGWLPYNLVQAAFATSAPGATIPQPAAISSLSIHH